MGTITERVMEAPMRRPLAIFLLGFVMSTQHACSEDREPRWAFHGLSYNQAADMPQVEILDCLYGNGLGAHTQREIDEGRARRGECGNIFGSGPIGDFLYVRWRDKATSQEYEDRVDLKSRLPSSKEMHGQTIYFLIDDNQLYVYLIPDRDWDTKRNHLPPGKSANGPDGYDFLDVKTLYPDNAPPKVRGGRPKARAAREAQEAAGGGKP